MSLVRRIVITWRSLLGKLLPMPKMSFLSNNGSLGTLNYRICETYTFIRKRTNGARSICYVSLCVEHIWDPHGDGWNECKDAGDGDANLDYLETCTRLVVVSQRKFQREQTVQVDEDKVVDRGAEQNYFHSGHQMTHQRTKCPPGGKELI